MTAGALDGIPGLGPARRARLVKELGGVRALREASAEELRALTWLPDRVADAVHEHLHAAGARPGKRRSFKVAAGRTPSGENGAG